MLIKNNNQYYSDLHLLHDTMRDNNNKYQCISLTLATQYQLLLVWASKRNVESTAALILTSNFYAATVEMFLWTTNYKIWERNVTKLIEGSSRLDINEKYLSCSQKHPDCYCVRNNSWLWELKYGSYKPYYRIGHICLQYLYVSLINFWVWYYEQNSCLFNTWISTNFLTNVAKLWVTPCLKSSIL